MVYSGQKVVLIPCKNQKGNTFAVSSSPIMAGDKVIIFDDPNIPGAKVALKPQLIFKDNKVILVPIRGDPTNVVALTDYAPAEYLSNIGEEMHFSRDWCVEHFGQHFINQACSQTVSPHQSGHNLRYIQFTSLTIPYNYTLNTGKYNQLYFAATLGAQTGYASITYGKVCSIKYVFTINGAEYSGTVTNNDGKYAEIRPVFGPFNPTIPPNSQIGIRAEVTYCQSNTYLIIEYVNTSLDNATSRVICSGAVFPDNRSYQSFWAGSNDNNGLDQRSPMVSLSVKNIKVAQSYQDAYNI